MKVWILVLASIVVGLAAAGVSLWLEFSGVLDQFEPHSQAARKGVSAGGNSALESPRATVVGGTEYDFGVGQRDSTLTHEFVIKNEGLASLKLTKGATSCKCTLSDLAKQEIPPGQSATAKLEWKIKTLGKEFRQTAEIGTNDPILPTIVLAVHGRVVDVVRLDPPELVLTGVSSGSGGEAQFRLYSYKAKDLAVVEKKFSNAELAPFFDAKFEPLTAEELQEDQDAVFGLRGTLMAKPGLPLGPLNQTLSLGTNVEGVQKLELSITGAVISDVSLVGPKNYLEEQGILKLGTVSATSGSETQMRLLVKGPQRHGVKVSVKEVDPDDVLAVTVGEPTEINNGAVFMYPVKIAVRQNSRPVDRLGSEKGKYGRITLETTHPYAKVIHMYVRFAVQ